MVLDAPSSRRIAVATCRAVPDLDDDGPLLLAALAGHGFQVDVRVWDEPGVDWSPYVLVLVRSTWDYMLRREQFVAWTEQCRRTSNPAPVLAWNTDKHYLKDLDRAGVPVVPTAFLEPGEPFTVSSTWPAGDVVVKPTVSASATDTGRYGPAAPEAQELTRHLHRQRRAVMVQPYQAQVEVHGETALVYLGGRFSHAVRKAALLTTSGTREPVVGDDVIDLIAAATARPDQLAVAQAALAAVPGGPESLTYARVDLVPDADGQPVLLELELTEPSLFLRYAAPDAVRRLAAAVEAAAAGS